MKGNKKIRINHTQQRLSNIENSLKEIEGVLNTSKIQLNHLNQVVQGIEEIKQNTKQKQRRLSLFPPKPSPKPPKPNVTQQVSELLQNPMILNLLLDTFTKPKSTSSKKSSTLLTQMNPASILSLLQNPAVQSLLTNLSPIMAKGKMAKGKRTK